MQIDFVYLAPRMENSFFNEKIFSLNDIINMCYIIFSFITLFIAIADIFNSKNVEVKKIPKPVLNPKVNDSLNDLFDVSINKLKDKIKNFNF